MNQRHCVLLSLYAIYFLPKFVPHGERERGEKKFSDTPGEKVCGEKKKATRLLCELSGKWPSINACIHDDTTWAFVFPRVPESIIKAIIQNDKSARAGKSK